MISVGVLKKVARGVCTMCLSWLMGCGDCVFVVLRCGVAPRFDSMVWHLFAAFFPGGFCEITYFFLRYWLGGVGCGNKRVLPACIGFILLTGT